uniref:Thrombospondin-like N-terminal domain-containing protein n=1 Tax=Pseudonaja textilis TaxID=8673 RepID=A0A670YUV9_PSETE
MSCTYFSSLALKAVKGESIWGWVKRLVWFRVLLVSQDALSPPLADGPFPVDFSILATMRALKGSQSFLFSLHDERGVQQLGVEIGRSPVFLYEDQLGFPAPEDYPHFHRVNLADGKWHRIALSVKGESVSLNIDCEDAITLPLKRSKQPVVSIDGVTLLGARRPDEDIFEVGKIIHKSQITFPTPMKVSISYTAENNLYMAPC